MDEVMMPLNFKDVQVGLQRFLTLESQCKSGDFALRRIFHYTRETADEKSCIHLRLDGTGTLIVNASSIMHLINML